MEKEIKENVLRNNVYSDLESHITMAQTQLDQLTLYINQCTLMGDFKQVNIFKVFYFKIKTQLEQLMIIKASLYN